MSQKAAQLNLARKWRSKQFDAVIGQDLSVRILQNSLYSNQFFPVYLFSGQRGCGKTTSARLFAAALNCENLELFQKNPREQKIPCLICASCKAMASHSHPDFIEIDAASYTGVDNVRDIIESAALLPVLGRKKMYLIDEAHMLSKAAFNAFLKILEEPPASVIFMLATTDPHKIIETVRSRCFQLFFNSIPTPAMAQHLAYICEQETIAYDHAALMMIASETEGSARDAINLLEQVRFSQQRVTLDAVVTLLGHMPEITLFDLFEQIMKGNLKQVMELLACCPLETYAPLTVWHKSTDLVKNLLFVQQGVKDTGIFQDKTRLTTLARLSTAAQLILMLKKIQSYELQLLRSTSQRTLLELMFIELCQANTGSPTDIPLQTSVNSVQPIQPSVTEPLTVASSQPAVQKSGIDERWSSFMAQVTQLSDPLLQSIFKQAQFVTYDESINEVKVLFEREAHFFTEWLRDTKTTWSGLLEAAFAPGTSLKPTFGTATHAPKPAPTIRMATPAPAKLPEKKQEQEPAQRSYNKSSYTKPTPQTASQELRKELAIDISDQEKWQKAHLVKEIFGGSIVAIQEDEKHEETGQ